jgi:hypothetical protein
MSQGNSMAPAARWDAPASPGKLKRRPRKSPTPGQAAAAIGACTFDRAAIRAAQSGATVSTRKEAQCFATLRFKPPTKKVR